MGRWFDVVVSVSGVQSTYLAGQWWYLPPVVTAVAPRVLPPSPSADSTLVVRGRNFGVVAGNVMVGGAVSICSSWNDSTLICTAPPGVQAVATVTVTAASQQRSLPSVVSVAYLAPEVQSVSTNTSGTAGGDAVTLRGVNFYTVSRMSVSVWLVKSVQPLPPWLPSPVLLSCPLDLSTQQTATALVCILPEGVGTHWYFVVVNHNVNGNATTDERSATEWQSSSAVAGTRVCYSHCWSVCRVGVGVRAHAVWPTCMFNLFGLCVLCCVEFVVECEDRVRGIA